jgi:uroporphyrinogen-III synthase
VLDLVTYRTRPNRLGRRTIPSGLAEADRVVVTSPSALSSLCRALDARTFRRLRYRRNLVVLGERSARAARGHGFGGVRVVPGVSDSEVGTFLLAELAHAG